MLYLFKGGDSMNYKLMRNCCFLLAAIILFVMLAFITMHTYNLWKNEGPKFSEQTFTKLLFGTQKGALSITLVGTIIPILLGIYFNVKLKEKNR